MIVSDEAFVMLLTKPFFQGFTRREPCDTTRYTEGLLALSNAQDHGVMHGWSFYDLDGHHWEVFRMDPKAAQ